MTDAKPAKEAPLLSQRGGRVLTEASRARLNQFDPLSDEWQRKRASQHASPKLDLPASTIFQNLGQAQLARRQFSRDLPEKRIFMQSGVAKRSGHIIFVDAHANGEAQSKRQRRSDQNFNLGLRRFACRVAETSENPRHAKRRYPPRFCSLD